jgi:hypothetical protein
MSVSLFFPKMGLLIELKTTAFLFTGAYSNLFISAKMETPILSRYYSECINFTWCGGLKPKAFFVHHQVNRSNHVQDLSFLHLYPEHRLWEAGRKGGRK